MSKKWPEAIEGRIATKNETGFMFTEISGASPAFIEYAKKSSGTVMDLGCAYGAVTLPVLQQANCKVMAFDLEQEHLDVLRASVSAAEEKKLITMQGYFPDDFKLEESLLDAIHSSSMFHFFTGPVLENGLHKCLLALKPGGKIYINVVSAFFSPFRGVLALYEKNAATGAKYPGEIFNYKKYADERSVAGVPDFLHVYKVEDLQQALQSAGFIIDEIFYYDKKEPAWFASDGKGHVAAIARRPW